MRLFNIDMVHIKDYFHCFIAISIAVFNDFFSNVIINITSWTTSLFFTYPDFHNFLLSAKDIISTVTVSAACIIMLVKLKRILKDKKS